MGRKHRLRTPPPVGSTYERTYKGGTYRMTVVVSGDGIAYKVGHKTYQTPTAAAKSLTRTEVNGWLFWRIDR